MLKTRSRKLSLVLVLAMLMTMFAGLGVANAATGYSASHVPLVNTDGTEQDLGSLVVSFDNLPAGNNAFIVKLPANFDLGTLTSSPIAGTVTVSFPNYDPAADTNQVMVNVYAATMQSEVKFAVNLKSKVPNGAPEAINATIIAQPGSVFADGVVQVAKTASGAVEALAGDAVTITAGGISGGKKVVIYFRENKDNALKAGAKSLTLKLPKGFEWVSPSFATLNDTYTSEFNVKITDTRTLEIDRSATTAPASIWKFTADVSVDESVAQFGDVEVVIGGASSITPGSVTIGKYADYDVTVVVDNPEKELLAGRNGQIISDFKFQENIGDSLLKGRTIYVELPSGVNWVNIGEWSVGKDGGVKFATGSPSLGSNKANILKIVVDEDGTSKGALEINRAQVAVAGNYTGDITAKIWGNAGINEEVVLGKVVAPISVSTDIKDIKIGVQKQAAGNIVIAETKAEAIDSYVYGAKPELTVTLPFNVSWGNVPTVKVIEGDLELGTASVTGGVLTIPVKTSSSVASKIEISDITYTADRTVPEGEMKATFAGSAIVQTDFTNRNYVVKEVVANCVTPAPGETIGSGEFRIGSNIYYVGGVAKVMDVAPYIKDSRTYVPMRYLGEILGAEVVWDDAARTVTLTRGDTTVVFTIGSTTYTVNGEAKTADVAPEITNSRTMLPARFVAEAFGAVVGWDAATQTVLIQK